MKMVLGVLCFLAAILMSAVSFPDGAIAALLVAALSFIVLLFLQRSAEDTDFLIEVFLSALLFRIMLGVVIHFFELRDFFGGDANTYDYNGQIIVDYWFGNSTLSDAEVFYATSTKFPGWGMNYLVAVIYFFTGRSILTAQSFCAVVGAGTAPLIYFCAIKIFNNRKVGKTAAVLVAFIPAFVVWSSQLLKDGLITFLVVLAMIMVIELQKRFSYLAIATLLLSLFGILSLRFYIFYMAAIAVAGSFVIGQTKSLKGVLRGVAALVVVGLAIVYLGVFDSATENFTKYGSLENVQQSRLDLSRTESGFGSDLDVSTASGAISAVPVGVAYLLLGPLPWEISNLRQGFALPEVLVWWAMFPIFLSGLWYTLKNRLRSAIPILIFTSVLTVAYSIYQGNFGTIYRHRIQIQIFMVIFVAVGWTLRQEIKENKRLLHIRRNRRQEKYFAELKNNDSTSEETK